MSHRKARSGRTETSGKAIWITEHDKKRLSGLIRGIKDPEQVGGLQQLQMRLNEARVVESREIPEDVVTMNCLVRLCDPDTLEETESWLRFSAESKSGSQVVPILSDLGIALLGSREGDSIEWDSPSGRKTNRIVQIVYQPERVGNYDF